jgi:ABC-2 type transport system ATP-binding protein
VISVRGLSHRYGARVALHDVSFDVGRAEVFGLLGPNGGGKSTLFRILSTMMAPTAGTALIAGYDIAHQPAEVRRRCGVVFQTQSLDRHLTVEENLRAQGRLHGLSGAILRERMREAMERLGLAGRARDLAGDLSGGLKRRLEIAKALLHRPQVLLMDEASTGLDPRAGRELWQYVDELRRGDGVTVLLTTHSLDEADRCDRLALLHLGKIVALGAPAVLKAKIGGDVVVLRTADPAALAPQIASRFGAEPAVFDSELRVEIANGHRFITEVVEAFPGSIESVGLHKPTLEDVFVHETGAYIE